MGFCPRVEMPIRFFNTLSRRLEDFRPLDPAGKKVTMYSCGPTVYQAPSIGNYRAFLLSDLLRRYLEYRGYEVRQVMNITDVGHVTLDADVGADKLEEAAKKEGKDPLAIARNYEAIFHKELQILGFLPAHAYPRATEYIPEMLEMVQQLVANGHAYVVNGSVYFSVESFRGYGSLSNNSLEQLVAGARVEVHPDKRHPADFALWKQDPRHVMQWKSPWGMGFPGWHIECSAMSQKLLADQFDIHTGGEDLVFPHHECEIAQSEGTSGKRPVVRYWLHNAYLLVDGRKMSKSLGNVVLVEDVLTRGFTGRQLRFALLRVNYRMPLNFTWVGMEDAAGALERLQNFVADLRLLSNRKFGGFDPGEDIERARREFEAGLDEDLNISSALAALFDLVSRIHERRKTDALSPEGARRVLAFLGQVNGTLGFLDLSEEAIQGELKNMLFLRDQYRKKKDWRQADAMRKKIEEQGYEIVDTPEGSQLRPKAKR